MSSTDFKIGTVITAPWLNDVDATVYEALGAATTPEEARSVLDLASRTDLALSTGSALVGTVVPSGTLRTVAAKLGDVISVKDFGAVGDGVTDDTAAIQAALTAALASSTRSLLMPGGVYLISSSLTLGEGVGLVGEGNRASYGNGTEGTPTRIKKKSGMTTAGVVMSGKRSYMDNIAVISDSAANGYGIHIQANFCSLRRVASSGHNNGVLNGDGIRIGSDNAGTYLNCNSYYLQEVTVAENDNCGIKVDDEHATGPGDTEANAGTMIHIDSRSNGSHGVSLQNSFGATLVGVLTESNAGYGVVFGTNAQKNTLVGGDQDEVNALGTILNQGVYNTFLGILSSGFTDSGTYTQMLGFTTSSLSNPTITGSSGIDLTSGLIKFPATQITSADVNTLDDYEEGTWTPTIGGTTTAGTGTYTLQVGTYTKIGNVVNVSCSLTWTNLTGAAGILVIRGLPFTSAATPSGKIVPLATVADGVALTAGNMAASFVFTTQTQIAVRQAPTGGGALASVGLLTSGTLYISGSYTV